MIKELLVVSVKPPLLLIIKAQPLLDASKLDLPKGSSHLDGTTEMLTFFKKFRIKGLDLKPKIFNFLCLKMCLSLGSSPITTELQSWYSLRIFIIALPKASNPFEEFNLPTKDIIFFLFLKLIFTFDVDWGITSIFSL